MRSPTYNLYKLNCSSNSSGSKPVVSSLPSSPTTKTSRSANELIRCVAKPETIVSRPYFLS